MRLAANEEPTDEATAPTSIKVYPNPSNGQLFIETPNEDKITVRIFSLSGQLVSEHIIAKASPVEMINISTVNNGIYLLQVLTSKENLQGKLVIIK